MMTTVISLEQAKEYLQHLDLSYIVDAMCSPHYPLPRWTEEDANHCAMLYKNFLFLHKKYLSGSLVPTKEIDEFWHNHILHTKRYHADCLQIFGHYFHHQPALPGEDKQQLVQDFLQTKQWYLETFNTPLVNHRLTVLKSQVQSGD